MEGKKYAYAEGLLLLSAIQVWGLVSCKISCPADFTRDLMIYAVCSGWGSAFAMRTCVPGLGRPQLIRGAGISQVSVIC